MHVMKCQFFKKQSGTHVQSNQAKFIKVIFWIHVAVIQQREWPNEFGESFKCN